MKEFVLMPSGGVQEKMTAIKYLIIELLHGGPVLVTIARLSKTRQQEKLYHALIKQFSKQISFDLITNEYENVVRVWGWGKKRRYSPDVWKALLVEDYSNERDLMNASLRKPGRTVASLDGTGRLVTIRPSTCDFSREEAASFIDYLYNKGIELGVKWPARADEIAASEREWLANNREAA